MRLLAIDPGRDTGWALFARVASSGAFTRGEYNNPGQCQPSLVGCGLVHADTLGRLPGLAGAIDTVVIERPESYSGQPVNPNNLLILSLRAGEVAGLFPRAVVQYVLPKVWKGQLPKEICHRRARAKMSAAELLVAKSKNHNIWDAIALGLWRLGR